MKFFQRFEKTILNHRAHIKLMVMILVSCSLVYFVFWSGHHYSIDGIVMFQYAKSLLFRNSFLLDPPIQWGMEIVVSKWAIGFTIVYMIILAGLSSLPPLKNIDFSSMPYAPGEKFNELLLYDPTYRYSSFINPLITAITAVSLYYLCVQLGLTKKKAAGAALIFGIASPATVYAKLDFAQPLASLFILLALIFMIKSRRNGRGNLIVSGIFLGLAVLCRPEMIIIPTFVFVAAAYLVESLQKKSYFFSLSGLKNCLLISIPVIVFVFFNQSINYLRFGSWIAVGYQPVKEFAFSVSTTFLSMISNFLHVDRGIFLFFPLSILSIFGMPILINKNRLVGFIILFTMAGSWIMYSLWADWDAGVSWGPRFFIPLMPYFVISAFFVFERDGTSPAWLMTIFILLTTLGAIIAFRGLLFTELSRASRIVFLGNIDINLDQLPFYIDFAKFRDPNQYDVRWLDVIGRISGIRNLLFFGCIFLLGFLTKIWADFFLARTK